MKVHTQKNLYKCLHCERSFTTNLSMMTHAKTHLTNSHVLTKTVQPLTKFTTPKAT